MIEYTLEELKEQLAKRFSECELVDILELTTFDLVDVLEDVIQEKYEKIVSELEELNNDEEN